MQGRNAHVVPMAQRFIALLTERVLPFFGLGANAGMTAVAVLGLAGS
jgi:hypothetical protein